MLGSDSTKLGPVGASEASFGLNEDSPGDSEVRRVNASLADVLTAALSAQT